MWWGSGTAAKIDVDEVETVGGDDKKVRVTLLGCRTIGACFVSQLNTQSELFERDALKMVGFPFL
jgi:hypothetical protein